MPPRTAIIGEDGKSVKFWTPEQEDELLRLIAAGITSNIDLANAMKKTKPGLTDKAIERKRGKLKKAGRLGGSVGGFMSVENRSED